MLLGKPRIHLEDFQDMLNFESEQEEVSSPTFGQSGVVELKFGCRDVRWEERLQPWILQGRRSAR